MKIKRMLFVGVVLLISVICVGIMNVRYDRLSRYPYQDEQARALISEYFSNQDIEYIIEYSISPSEFIDFVSYPGFSVYHASDYTFIKSSIWYLTDQEIVEMVELARDQMTMDQLVQYLLNYDGSSVKDYLLQGDEYAPDSVLVEHPEKLTALVDDTHTLGKRHHYDLTVLDPSMCKDHNEIMISTVVAEPLKAMCEAIQTELSSKSVCGGLLVEQGYLGYQQQVEYYESKKDSTDLSELDYPGHSEHQLGYALDFSIKGTDQNHFDDSEQYAWLISNAHRFGFVETYQKNSEELLGKTARPWHWRYVGYDLAAKMYFEQLSLQEAAS